MIVHHAPDVLLERIDETRQVCERALQLLARESSAGPRAMDRATLVALVPRFAAGLAEAERALVNVPDEPRDRMLIVRKALLAAVLQSLDRLADLPVPSSVKLRFCEVFARLSRPPRGPDPWLRPDRDFQGCAVAQCVLLRRFPAGQLDWEISGLPRSYLLRMPWRDLPRVLRTVTVQVGGLQPLFVTHMGLCRYSLLFLENESLRSYYRIAQSMAMQPEIKGLLMASWYHSAETIRVSPHLAWTNRIPVAHGAVLTDVGPASPGDGFLVGSRERQRLFDSGRYHPRIGVIIWARRDLLEWASTHPDYAAESGTG